METQVEPVRSRTRRAASVCLLPLMRRAARAYIAGDTLNDALAVADALSQSEIAATVGYWNSDEESPRHVADLYLAAIQALASREGAYLSIKAPAIGFSSELISEVAQQAKQDRVRLHFDGMAPDTVDRTQAILENLLPAGLFLGTTLPGRWKRSVDDARWAADRGLSIRVVKGQWADPSDPARDLRAGFLEVIDQLAGRAPHVAVASHDVPLAAEAIARLRSAGTSCELELLHGLPMKASLRLARKLAVNLRVYVPYGKAYLPYALSRVRSNPRLLWWLIKDMLALKGPTATIAG